MLKSFRHIIIALAALMAALPAGAQINSLPVRTVNGRPCHYYQVKPKDTVYSLCHAFGITKEELTAANPSVAEGLREGQVLYFPVTSERGAARHTVKDKETVYGISHRFGITTDQLLAWNPEARDGLRPGQVLIVSDPGAVSTVRTVTATTDSPATSGSSGSPVMAPTATSAPSDHLPRYTIRDGETLFSIARAHGVTVDQILALNPDLDRDHYRGGQVIALPVNATAGATSGEDATTNPVVRTEPQDRLTPVDIPSEPVAVTQPDIEPEHLPADTVAAPYTLHTVGKDETFYSIARAAGVTIEELEALNPTVGILREGMVLRVPSVSTQPASSATPALPTPALDADAGEIDPTAGMITPADEPERQVRVALVLPLMLSQQPQPRQAQLYTEFYKGFLLAVDSLRTNPAPIHVAAFDTEGSAAKVSSIIADPALAEADVIVAPDSEEHLDMLGQWARQAGKRVLNLFVVKDESYLTNPAMMQGNIPHHQMYDKAIAGLTGRFGRFTPVILGRREGPADKLEFVKELKHTLDSLSLPYHEIDFDGVLKASDLAPLAPEGAYVFIPVSGRQAELNRIIPALTELREGLTDADPVRLFGYPEWTTFRGETLVGMHKLNTLVYSRFFTVPEDPEVQSVEQTFERWYGEPMSNFVPRQGLFGFDTGMFLIKALSQPGASDAEAQLAPYIGVQNGFNFVPAAHEGSCGSYNDELYFINFRPSGLIDKIAL